MPLFHYTSTEALLSILKTGVLRMTDFRYLNDTTELTLLNNAVYRIARDRPISSEAKAEVLARAKVSPYDAEDVLPGDEFRKELWEEFRSISDNVTFLGVTCFSSKGNDLSQWRAYTPYGSGVVIEFDETIISKWGEDDRHELRKCNYDLGVFQKAVEEWVDRGDCLNGWDSPDATAKLHADLILFEAARHKHRTFVDEDESRLVTLPCFGPADYHPDAVAYDDALEDIKFRTARYTAVPYVEFLIRRQPGPDKQGGIRYEDGELTAIRSITVGPTREPDLAVRALQLATRQAGIIVGDDFVRHCELPYRAL